MWSLPIRTSHDLSSPVDRGQYTWCCAKAPDADVTTNMVEVYQRYRGPYCLHRQDSLLWKPQGLLCYNSFPFQYVTWKSFRRPSGVFCINPEFIKSYILVRECFLGSECSRIVSVLVRPEAPSGACDRNIAFQFQFLQTECVGREHD